MEGSEELVWLVESRSKAQRLLLDLYVFLHDKRETLNRKPAERSVFGLLVGAGFSLWRAAFLVTRAKSDWPDVLEEAESFLKKLVEDNWISFDREDRARDWTSGYYLNNARYRLKRVLEKLAELAPKETRRSREFQRFADVIAPGGIDEKDRVVAWDVMHDALRAAFDMIKSTVA